MTGSSWTCAASVTLRVSQHGGTILDGRGASMDDPRGVLKASPIRRHARWIAPLLWHRSSSTCVLELSHPNERKTLEGWSLLAALVLLAGIFVALIVLVVVCPYS